MKLSTVAGLLVVAWILQTIYKAVYGKPEPGSAAAAWRRYFESPTALLQLPLTGTYSGPPRVGLEFVNPFTGVRTTLFSTVQKDPDTRPRVEGWTPEQTEQWRLDK